MTHKILSHLEKKTFVVYNLKAKHVANEYAKTFKELCDQSVKVTFQAINDKDAKQLWVSKAKNNKASK